MLVVRCRIRISGVTRCSHRCGFYVLQLQPIITDALDSRICNNLGNNFRFSEGDPPNGGAPPASTSGNARFADDTQNDDLYVSMINGRRPLSPFLFPTTLSLECVANLDR